MTVRLPRLHPPGAASRHSRPDLQNQNRHRRHTRQEPPRSRPSEAPSPGAERPRALEPRRACCPELDLQHSDGRPASQRPVTADSRPERFHRPAAPRRRHETTEPSKPEAPAPPGPSGTRRPTSESETTSTSLPTESMKSYAIPKLRGNRPRVQGHTQTAMCGQSVCLSPRPRRSPWPHFLAAEASETSQLAWES